MDHVIKVEGVRTIGSGRRDWWRASCSCGDYFSGLHAFPGRAEAAGAEHAKAKNA